MDGGVFPGQRFGWGKDGLGSSKAFVLIADGAIELHHPLLKQRLSMPIGQVRACAEVHQIGPLEWPLRREPRRVDFPLPLVDATLILLLSPAVHLDQLTRGAEKRLAITARERKRGVDVDLIGLFPAEPDALAGALEASGAARYLSLPDMLRREIGEASGPDAISILEQRRRARRSAGWKLLLVGCFVSAVIGAMMNAPDPMVSDGSLIASAVVAMLSAAALGLLIERLVPAFRRIRPPRRADVRWSAARAVGALAATSLLVVVLVRLGRDGLVPGFAGSGLAGGIVGCWGMALAFHVLEDPAR